MGYRFDTSNLSRNPKEATKTVADILFNTIYPLILRVRNRLQRGNSSVCEEDLIKLRDVYALCLSQIKKSLQTSFEIFKTEYHRKLCLQESRQCTLERLSWCINRLINIEEYLDHQDQEPNNIDATSETSILATPMYFVNWIDHTFDILSKLADIIYKPDCMSNSLQSQWKEDVIDCVSTLHISLDELLLSAMTLGKYCLQNDQRVITARCQVVLREAKALLSELIEGDLETAYRATPDLLKLPLKPSNVNILIDVLKDVLYALETNTNTALLALLIHCFCGNKSPVDVLKEHFEKAEGSCSCFIKSGNEVVEDCSLIKEFDLYNERLMQIGSFAVSCSSDHNRMTALRSGLATLEALDPHLVPALLVSPGGHHAHLLAQAWRQEVKEIRDCVFLIVDPGAFAEKSKQLMHQTLLEIIKQKEYDNALVCEVINIGCVVRDFFGVYIEQEPDALVQQEKLTPLLADLNKVQLECKIVSNLLSSGEDFMYPVKKVDKKNVSIDQLIKRLKLLYTLVNRINSLHHPKDNEDQLFENDFEDEHPKNVTHTIEAKISDTYVQSHKKQHNVSRSIFVRTEVRSSTRNFPLSKLTKHLQAKKSEEISFSVKLDQLFNMSDFKSYPEVINSNKAGDSIRETSILYKFSPKKRSSLRKAVLNKHCKILEQDLRKTVVNVSNASVEGEVVDEATSLQITDILNEMNDITNTFSKKSNEMIPGIKNLSATNGKQNNVTRIKVNVLNATTPKRIWNIPVNSSTVEMALNDTAGTNISQPSNVTTQERLNDIDLVESKLNSLKYCDIETSL